MGLLPYFSRLKQARDLSADAGRPCPVKLGPRSVPALFATIHQRANSRLKLVFKTKANRFTLGLRFRDSRSDEMSGQLLDRAGIVIQPVAPPHDEYPSPNLRRQRIGKVVAFADGKVEQSSGRVPGLANVNRAWVAL